MYRFTCGFSLFTLIAPFGHKYNIIQVPRYKLYETPKLAFYYLTSRNYVIHYLHFLMDILLFTCFLRMFHFLHA